MLSAAARSSRLNRYKEEGFLLLLLDIPVFYAYTCFSFSAFKLFYIGTGDDKEEYIHINGKERRWLVRIFAASVWK